MNRDLEIALLGAAVALILAYTILRRFRDADFGIPFVGDRIRRIDAPVLFLTVVVILAIAVICFCIVATWHLVAWLGTP
jgi:hypothetical protein